MNAIEFMSVSDECDAYVLMAVCWLHRFYLTYNIANNLQDFLSVRLYWGLESQLSLLQKTGKSGATRGVSVSMSAFLACH